MPSKTQEGNNTAQDYKLVVYRSEDFKEVRTLNLSIRSIYVAISSLLLLLCFAIFALLAFTPLKRLVPGYGQMESNPRFLQLIDGVDELGEQIDAQGTYLGALRTLLRTGMSDVEFEYKGDLDISDASTYVNISSPSMPLPSSAIATDNDDIHPIIGAELYQTFMLGNARKPVSGLVSSTFDPTIKHYGVDILAPAETPIVAMMDGIVFSSGWDLETGYSIAIQHDDNILSFYKHNSQLLKEKGTFVRAGEAVAIIGNTGTLSSGPHLHFELWHNGKPINPQDVFKF